MGNSVPGKLERRQGEVEEGGREGESARGREGVESAVHVIKHHKVVQLAGGKCKNKVQTKGV